MMSDAILNGDFCELCGCYLSEGCGIPRKCEYCYKEEEETLAIKKESV